MNAMSNLAESEETEGRYKWSHKFSAAMMNDETNFPTHNFHEIEIKRLPSL